ncbi:hypothetical protein [Bacillus sp. ISL-45]|uniref:hypothetical protein n=1 Tax=Bacillus sp. ISL-45 TaxID=2819128 RepID=UPI001BECA60A|nr:hypothetical protein [Bacillus sp. ISL-45]
MEKELESHGYSLDRELSLVLRSDFFAYNVTPFDVITFADTGSDGIHFGFLTDFGMVTDLDNAFIVCVSPMDFGCHIKIVARNLQEFLNLLYTMKSAVTISNFVQLSSEDEEQYKKLKLDLEKEEKDNPKFFERADFVVEKLQSALECQLIDNIYEYIENTVADDRKKQTVLTTRDGIGVVPLSPDSGEHGNFHPEKGNSKDVSVFFDQATTESKLAFIRDAQFTNQIQDDIELQELVISEMKKLGFHDEAHRAAECLE